MSAPTRKQTKQKQKKRRKLHFEVGRTLRPTFCRFITPITAFTIPITVLLPLLQLYTRFKSNTVDKNPPPVLAPHSFKPVI